MKYRFDSERHIHLLDEKPLFGTSTVVQVLSKNLTWWAAELSAVTCLESPERVPTIRTEYLEAVSSPDKKKAMDKLQKKYPVFKAARFAHFNDKNKKAEKGVDLHAEIEGFIKYKMGVIPPPVKGFNERIQPFIDWAEKNVKRFLWSEAHCYSENLYCGGITDFGVELNGGGIFLGDIKSSKVPYTSHWLQGSGYCLQIEENGLFTGDGEKTGFVSSFDGLIIVPFGAEKVEPVFNPLPLDEYKKGFKACVELHKLVNMEKREE